MNFPDIRRLLVFLLLLSACVPAMAQIRIISPYSRFGLGDLAGNNNAWNSSMGQLGIGLRSPIHVNYGNPASYTAFDSMSFVFEGGFNGEFVTLTSDFQKVSRSNASLGYLLFGIPATRWWKTSLGLIPYSDVGYNVANYEEYPQSGTVVRLYGGTGGISRIFWGNAFKPWKSLSVGFNLSYLFGSMNREAAVYFPDSLNALNFREIYYVSMNDLNFSFGAQYHRPIHNDISMTVGAVFSPTLNMAAKTDILATTFLMNANGVESPRDTLVNKEDFKGHITLPMMIGGGLSFEKSNKWLAGIDYSWQNWENFRAFEMSDSLVNSWQISAGGQIIPNIDNFSNYLARVHYRLGFTYNKTYLRLRGQELNEYAVSLGFGLPLRGMKTMLNLGFQFGSRGTTSENLIRESYFKMVLGFSIYERWFVKRKYF